VNGSERLRRAKEHEIAVCERITAAGWTCEAFGQGMLSETMRDVLKVHRTPIRWMPDLIAVRDEVLLIDAKYELRTDTPNFSIECSAIDAHQRWSIALAVPIVYVFADFTVNYVHGLRPVHEFHDVRGQTRGSGTDFVLIRKDEQHPFDEIFGQSVTSA
jgi:hypothetical protein